MTTTDPINTSFEAWVAEYEATLDAEGLAQLEAAREAARRKRDADDAAVSS